MHRYGDRRGRLAPQPIGFARALPLAGGARGLASTQQVERLALLATFARASASARSGSCFDAKREHRLLAPVQLLRVGPLVGQRDPLAHLRGVAAPSRLPARVPAIARRSSTASVRGRSLQLASGPRQDGPARSGSRRRRSARTIVESGQHGAVRSLGTAGPARASSSASEVRSQPAVVDGSPGSAMQPLETLSRPGDVAAQGGVLGQAGGRVHAVAHGRGQRRHASSDSA